MNRPRFLLTLALLASASPALAQQATLIENVSVFDGERLSPKRSVLIQGDRIANPDFRGKAKPGVIRVDGKGKTLMPGMIDAHVHAMQGLDTALLFGVTTELDMFTAPQMNAEAKARTKAGGNTNMADLYSAGWLATVPKGHGTQFDLPVPTLSRPEEADGWVAARLAEGSDFIKIINEDGVSVGRTIPTLDAATTRALVEAAHKRGKRAVVHVQTRALAERAVEAGADGLVHIFFDKPGDAAFAALAKRKGAFVTPTLTVFEGYAGRPGSGGLVDAPAFKGLLPRIAIETLKAQIGADRTASIDANVKATITALAKAGVPILAGTDSGNPATWYGISMHRELELLVAAGLTPTQALTAATAAPARAYGLDDRGRIAKGMKADLLLVEGDPTRDIKATRALVEVWKNGVATTPLRTARRAAVAAEAEALAKGPPLLTLPPDDRILTLSSVGGKPVLTAPFGAWSETTDSIMGGQSTISLALVGAAPNDQPALSITGDVKAGAFAQWSGIGFTPGQNFSPVNMGMIKSIRFLARGEGPGFGVMGFSQATAQRPIINSFKPGKDWSEQVIRFADLKGFDPASAYLLTIAALQPGVFKLEIADVRLMRE